MKFQPEYPKGSTPLDPDELNGLIPDDIITQSELNFLEQQNIIEGKSWALKYRKEILDESFVRLLHKRMYGDVWAWSGQYRTTQKSIGIDSSQISTQVFILMKDVQTWIEHQSYNWTEILAHFHHRLVFIHPFPNGNGRYSRLHTDLLAAKYNQQIPTWGAACVNGDINQEGGIRERYIQALKQADQKKFDELIHFLYL